jgi:hypothetical protein
VEAGEPIEIEIEIETGTETETETVIVNVIVNVIVIEVVIMTKVVHGAPQDHPKEWCPCRLCHHPPHYPSHPHPGKPSQDGHRAIPFQKQQHMRALEGMGEDDKEFYVVLGSVLSGASGGAGPRATALATLAVNISGVIPPRALDRVGSCMREDRIWERAT